MYHIVESTKAFEVAAADLDAAVKKHGFGVLHVHDLGNTFRSKGMPFTEQCRVFEVCNPAQAAKVLAADMRINMALSCRISVYTRNGKPMPGLIKPVAMLTALSDNPALALVAEEVEAATMQMVNDAK